MAGRTFFLSFCFFCFASPTRAIRYARSSSFQILARNYSVNHYFFKLLFIFCFMQRYCSLGLAALLTLSSCVPPRVVPTSPFHQDYHLRLADDLSWRTIGRGAEFVYLAH